MTGQAAAVVAVAIAVAAAVTAADDEILGAPTPDRHSRAARQKPGLVLGSEIRTHNDPNQPCWSGETAQALSDWIGGGNDDGIQLTKDMSVCSPPTYLGAPRSDVVEEKEKEVTAVCVLRQRGPDEPTTTIGWSGLGSSGVCI
ncbi:hypothetical protein An09g04920 [Aspergillus niger]|uniref:Uncharacterized protein n=2 Tax=Aspergillus niger TaxID=5061 RepID=A2QUA3_ASPNC|nr:hypothetical protein An09g04920 [Aspergillus niger]CAK40346.1 hypothetical protein An09g04920 [Aspergillus niger]